MFEKHISNDGANMWTIWKIFFSRSAPPTSRRFMAPEYHLVERGRASVHPKAHARKMGANSGGGENLQSISEATTKRELSSRGGSRITPACYDFSTTRESLELPRRQRRDSQVPVITRWG